MNRGLLQNGLVHQMVMDGSNTKWWSISNTRPSLDQVFSLLPQPPPSLSSSTDSTTPAYNPQYLSQQSSIVPVASLPGSQDLPDSWSQLLLGGIVGEEEKYELSLLQPKKTVDNWDDEQMINNLPQLTSARIDANHVNRGHENSGTAEYFHGHGKEDEGYLTSTSQWRQILPAAASSPRSCITTSFSSSMLDFSNSKRENKRHQADNSSECNGTSTGEALKKPRVQVSSSAQSTFKVRKEKLGDRITALHQLVSPFGKTDTASVLLEAIGYIRFLQSQIEALSSPYLDNGSGNKRQPIETTTNDEQPKKDLRSRGLCLVPVSFTFSDAGADFWAAAFTAGSGGAASGSFL